MDFMEIYDQYHDRIKNFIQSLVKDDWATDDLLQDTFLKVRKHMDSVRDVSKLSSWIYRIAYNLCLDHFASKKKGGQVKEETDVMIRETVDTEIEQHQMGVCVQKQMDHLPESLRAVLIMYDILGFTHKEISEILDITEENSKVRLHRARKSFKKILNEKCSFEVDQRNVLICEPLYGGHTKND